MRSFILEKGRNHLTSLELSSEGNLLSELGELNRAITNRINLLERDRNVVRHFNSWNYSDTNSHHCSNLVMNLFTRMHQRKKKTFSDLYACYMKDSQSCIQRKFPQLDKEQCEKVQKKIQFYFFSQSILLNYLNALQSSINAILNSPSIPVDDLLIFCNELDKISDFEENQESNYYEFWVPIGKVPAQSWTSQDIELFTSEESNSFKSVVIQGWWLGKTLVLERFQL